MGNDEVIHLDGKNKVLLHGSKEPPYNALILCS